MRESNYGDKVPKIEPVTSVLVHCNLVDNDYQRISNQSYYTQLLYKVINFLFQINPLVVY